MQRAFEHWGGLDEHMRWCDQQVGMHGEYDANLVPIGGTVYIGTTPVAVFKETGTAASSTIQISIGNVYADQIDTPRVITRNSDEAIVWRAHRHWRIRQIGVAP